MPPVRFEVWKGPRLVMTFSLEPGVLSSTAALDPGLPPEPHPFVNATAHDALAEDVLVEAFRSARSTQELFQRLARLGFEVRPQGALHA
jgi:hypothetical protein